MIHVLGIIAVSAVLLLCIFSPFLPFYYDPLAAPLSSMAQVLGVVGLIAVPFGALWTASRYANWLRAKERVWAMAALIVLTLLGLLVSLVALATSGFLLAILTLIAVTWLLNRARLRPGTLPLYLTAVPPIVTPTLFALATPATEFARTRVIEQSAPMIADIERYRAANGRYPVSMAALHNDYRPLLLGTREFRYEPHGDSYNVYFEQFTFELGTQTIVMYNPLDEHIFTSHDSDLLTRSPAELAMRRGYYSVRDTRHPHWKYFSFD